MDGLTAGRIVHIRDGHAASPKCQPAIVVQVWDDGHGINAVVFRDGSNDDRHDGGNGELTRWATSIPETSEYGATFHDPRGCSLGS